MDRCSLAHGSKRYSTKHSRWRRLKRSHRSKKKLASTDKDTNQVKLSTNPGSRTFLLLGSHEDNTDTMIIAHADPVRAEITMISVPRDLYWKGRKINGYYQLYGPEQFMKEFSEMSGLNIDRYMSIDMFAFIEAVNALGGIDISLDQTLVDPSYRTFDNGVWSTLYYSAGTHHLNGVQALRIARSRATTMDFGRAKRQQLILKAGAKKLADVALREPARLYPLINIMLKNVQTNFSPFELAQLALQYRNADFDTGNVIDTENVVYSTYSNVYFLPQEEKIAAFNDPNYPHGLWILLPRSNDWDKIKTFIADAIR